MAEASPAPVVSLAPPESELEKGLRNVTFAQVAEHDDDDDDDLCPGGVRGHRKGVGSRNVKPGTAVRVVTPAQAVRLRLGQVVVLRHLPVGERSGGVWG